MNEEKRRHLVWAIGSRAKNQACSLRLLVLFSDHPSVWRTKKYSRAAQDLTAVAFSLWRAAFLANKTGRRSDVFAHAKDFLERVVEDNAIAYTQDKNAREWTFNYYTRNARASLQTLHSYWPQVPAYVGKKRNPTERWDYCQELFEQAVTAFEQDLASRKAKRTTRKAGAPAKSARQKRAIVRKMILDARPKTPAAAKP